MEENNFNEGVTDPSLQQNTGEIVIASFHTDATPHNSFKAKYSLIAVGNNDVFTEINARPAENADINTYIIPRAYDETSKEIYINIMYRGNSEILTEIQPIGYNNLEAEIEIPPHNRMSALYEIQQPPIITDIFNPTQDAFTREKMDYQTINYGGYSSMVVGRSLNDIWRSFVQFDLSSIHPSYVLTDANLRLYYSNSIPQNITLELLNANNSWSEYGITHLNRPTPIKLITNHFTINKQAGYVEFNVFDIVKNWVALTQLNNGFIIRVSNEITDGQVTFKTRESKLPPALVVEYYDSRIFSFGRSQHITEIFVYKRQNSDKNTEITVDSTFESSDQKTYLYVHRSEVPLDEDICVEITANKPCVPTELIVAIPKDSDITTEISVRNPRDSRILIEIIVNKPTIPIEISASRRKEDELDTELVVTKPCTHVEITIPTYRDSDIKTEIDINTIYASIVDTEIIVSKETIPIEITPRVIKDNNLYTEIAVSKPKVHIEIEVKYRSDIWVEIEPNIKSDILIELVVSKPTVEALVTARVNEDADSDAEIFVAYVSEINTEIIARKVSQINTEITSKAVSQINTDLSVSKPKILVEITIPTWDDSDIVTTIEPRILMVDNIDTVIVVNGGVTGYAFIM
ncbi:DNRLRE domain-containing protein [Lysinibacillus sphaericus]|uniref:DNRLRE domain-containing protein n=1 Tax=Lysinibacillus sphaericus TaxID=1421 RepID=UPI003F7A6745